jgi:hypothetical protein
LFSASREQGKLRLANCSRRNLAGACATPNECLTKAILRGKDHLAQICATSQKAWEVAPVKNFSHIPQSLGMSISQEFLTYPSFNLLWLCADYRGLRKSGAILRFVRLGLVSGLHVHRGRCRSWVWLRCILAGVRGVEAIKGLRPNGGFAGVRSVGNNCALFCWH